MQTRIRQLIQDEEEKSRVLQREIAELHHKDPSPARIHSVQPIIRTSTN
jgi:hypothetical protein